MNAWEEERRIAKIDRNRLQNQKAGPSQYSFSTGLQEKQPITAAARRAL